MVDPKKRNFQNYAGHNYKHKTDLYIKIANHKKYWNKWAKDARRRRDTVAQFLKRICNQNITSNQHLSENQEQKILRFLFGLLASHLVSELQPSLSSQKQTPPLHPCGILGIAQNIV